ncbi:MAG: hypothetical protein ACRCVT_12750, partial [Leadbetterella sp.]
MVLRKFWLFLFFLTANICLSVFAQKVKSSDINSSISSKAFATNPKIEGIQGKYLLKDTSSAKFFFRIEYDLESAIPSTKDFKDRYKIQWSLIPETGLREKLQSGKVELNESTLSSYEQGVYVFDEFTKPLGLKTAVFILEIIDSRASTKYSYDIPMDFSGKRINTLVGMYKN